VLRNKPLLITALLLLTLIVHASETGVTTGMDNFQAVSLARVAFGTGDFESAFRFLSGIEADSCTTAQMDAVIQGLVDVAIVSGIFSKLAQLKKSGLSRDSIDRLNAFSSFADSVPSAQSVTGLDVPLVSNTIQAVSCAEQLDLLVSSSLARTLILSLDTARQLNGLEQVGRFRYRDRYVGADVYCRTALLKNLKIGDLEFRNVPVQVIPGIRDMLPVGLLSGSAVIIDYKTGRLQTRAEIEARFDAGMSAMQVTGTKPSVDCSIPGWGITTRIPLDLAEGVTIIPRSIFARSWLEDYFFSTADVVTRAGSKIRMESIPWSLDADLDISGAALYNSQVYIAPPGSSIPPALTWSLFDNTTICIDPAGLRISVVPAQPVKEQCIEYLSENMLKECEALLAEADLSPDVETLFRAIILHRQGSRRDAVNYLLSGLEEQVEKGLPLDNDLLYYAILFIEGAAEGDESARIQAVLESDRSLHADPTISRVLAGISRSDGPTTVTGSSGRIGMNVDNYKIYPRFSINGKAVNRIIFDTGWPLLTICRADARKLGVKIAAREAIKVTSGFNNKRVLYWDLGIADRLELGGVVVENVLCSITPRPVFPGIRGAIGGPLINRFDYIIDGPGNTIYFRPRQYRAPDDLEQDERNLFNINGKPYVTSVFEEALGETLLLFDTGNDFSFATFPALIRNRVSASDYTRDSEGNIDILGIHFYPVLRAPVNITMGGSTKYFSDFVFRGGPEFHFPEVVKNYGNLGYEMLGSSRVQVNWSRGTFTIQDSTDPDGDNTVFSGEEK
jgi:hypothetical protein